LVGVVPDGVEEVAPDVLPVPVEPEVLEPVPVAPIELVPPVVPLPDVPLPLAVVSVELEVEPVVEPVVEPDEPVMPEEPLPVEPVPAVDGEVVDELVAPEPLVPAVSAFLPHALRDNAATTAIVATATCVIDVFIRYSLEGVVLRFANGKGSRDCPVVTLGGTRGEAVGTDCISL
jgi:hypothetical protein